jgi:hypothetical protein
MMIVRAHTHVPLLYHACQHTVHPSHTLIQRFVTSDAQLNESMQALELAGSQQEV